MPEAGASADAPDGGAGLSGTLHVVVAAPPIVCSPADLAALAGPADLIELRLDLLVPSCPDATLAAWIEAAPRPVLATVRSVEEGGLFEGGAEAAAQLLAEAAGKGAAWIDVEDAVRPHLPPLPGSLRQLSSRHGPLGAADRSTGAEGLRKRACPVDDAAAWAGLTAAHGGANADTFFVPYGALACTRGAFVGGARRGLLYGSAGDEAAVVPGQPRLDVLLDELRAGEVSPAADLHGLVGNPPTRSPSPAMHNAVFRARGVDALYVPLGGMTLEQAMALPVQGLSVTHPYKLVAHAAADELDDAARESGSVNTLVRVGRDRWRGYDTDAEAVEGLTPDALPGQTAFVHGAGGFARSAIHGLRRCGFKVRVGARDPQAAGQLGVEVVTGPYVRRQTDRVVVNATPAGADGRPVPAFSEADLAELIVLDAPYGPRGLETGLVAQARAQAGPAGEGWVVDGRTLLVGQAAGQARVFSRTGSIEIDGNVREVLLAAVDPPASLFLLGTRGAGKTTVGRALARRMGRPFVDLDEEVTRVTGRTPAGWIGQAGWEAFRRVEAMALERVACRQGLVVALGGGVVDHAPNIALLRQVGTKILLSVDSKTAARRIAVDRTERPLHPGQKDLLAEARMLIERRRPLWEALADHCVDARGSVRDVSRSLHDRWCEQRRS